MLALSAAALYFIKPKYSSSTTILVQKEETLNPLILYSMAVTLASEDRLQSFNEIVYSRSTVEMLIDELELAEEAYSQRSRQELVEKVRSYIGTHSNSSDSFEITFFNHDPEKAKRGAELIANRFMQTRIEMETRKNEETVTFFEQKVAELEEVVTLSREEMLSRSDSQGQQVPVDEAALHRNIQEIERDISSLDWQIYQNEQNLEQINQFLDSSGEEYRFQLLYNMPLSDMRYGGELGDLLEEHDRLNMLYTPNYPQTREVRQQIIEVSRRIPSSIESTINMDNRRREQLAAKRNEVLNNLEAGYIASRQRDSQQSDFSVYEALYNEMVTKLEQAKMTRDLGRMASENFIVLDAAVLPEKPVSPNKKMVLGLGLFSGIIFGIFLAGAAEALDTTVRTVEKIKYHKPVVAYITYE